MSRTINLDIYSLYIISNQAQENPHSPYDSLNAFKYQTIKKAHLGDGLCIQLLKLDDVLSNFVFVLAVNYFSFSLSSA